MNYLRIYNELIYKRKYIEPQFKAKNQPGIIETQHIIPRCCNGSNEKWNKVNLTVREHFVAHWLLTKIYANTQFEEKINHAFFMMSNRISKHSNIHFNSRSYAFIRQKIANYMHENNPLFKQDARLKLSKSKKGCIPWNKNNPNCMPEPWNKGKKMSKEFKQHVSEGNIRRFQNPLERLKLRKKHKKMNEAARKNMAAARLGTRYINNGVKQTKIKPNIDGTIPEPYKSQGYIFGYLKKPSNETKQKISAKLKGLKRTEEQKKRYSLSKMGDKNPMWKNKCLQQKEI